MGKISEILGEFFDSGDHEFNDRLGPQPSNHEIEDFSRAAAKHYANVRVLRLRSKLAWFLSGVSVMAILFSGFLAVPGFRIAIAESIFPAQDRLKEINDFLRENTTLNQEAQKVKTDLRDILLDPDFQKELVIDNLKDGKHKLIGFDNFPQMAEEDIWDALGSAKEDKLSIAFDREFIDFITESYSGELEKRFERLQETNVEEVRSLLYELGNSPQKAALKVMSKSAEGSDSQCGVSVEHSKKQVEVALPRDVWNLWNSKRAFIYLQCENENIPVIYLTIRGSNNTVENVELVGIVPSETKNAYEDRIADFENESEIAMQPFLDPVNVEVRVTNAVKNQLGNSDGQITFFISRKFLENN